VALVAAGCATADDPSATPDAGDDANGDATACESATEVCNGEDDDCDGQTDEDIPALTCGTGTCMRSTPACVNGVVQTCTPGMVGTETCNGMDDDCDGTPDNVPMLTCGMGICATTAPGCSGGATGTCTPLPSMPEVCNNLDDNCDGTPDNKAMLTCGMGICAATAPACVGGVDGTCTPGTPQAEVCNNLDDNCDGTPDNKAPLSCGTGQCATMAPACVGGADGTCTPGSPVLEICSNGLDEDCNGSDLQPVSNTTCGTYAAMTTGTTNGDNTCSGADVVPAAQNDCNGTDGGGNDSMFAFGSDGTPARWTIRMTGVAGYDTVLHVHSSPACNSGDQLQCSDDFSGTNVSEVVVDGLPNGGGYYVVADSFNTTNNRTFALTMSGVFIDHDSCTSPAPIRGNGAFSYTTTGKTNNYTAPAGCSSLTPTASPDVVYRIVARTTGTITASTAGSAFDTLLWVSSTCGTGSIACNDDFNSTTQSQISWSATAGATYYLIVDGFSSSAAGNYVLTISGY